MKTLKISVAVIALSIALAGLTRPVSTTEKFAEDLLGSLTHSSIDGFKTLLPTLDEFYEIMDKNAGIYGSNLEAAKQEFADQYNHSIMPEVLDSYNSVKHQAANQDIDWSKVSFLRVSVDEDSSSDVHKLTVYFSTDGAVRRLVVGNAIKIKGQWKITDRVTLI